MEEPSRGRPSKLDQNPDLKSIIIEVAKLENITNDTIAKICGVCPRTLDTWLKSDEDFLRSVNIAKQQADAGVALSVYKNAMGLSVKRKETYFEDKNGKVVGDKQVTVESLPPNQRSAEFWLMNRNRKDWVLDKDDPLKESTITISHDDANL